MKGLVGTKIGMTQMFTTDGNKVPVTVVYVEPNQVIGVKTQAKDGYVATQVGYYTVSENKLNKPENGIFKKVGSEPKRYIRELRNVDGYSVGDLIKVDAFNAGDIVDVQGITKGHGFTGSIKRHNFSVGPLGHGAGYPHRYVGSICGGRGGSQAQRVFKGTELPGHYGHETVTMTDLTVMKVDLENNLILIKGSIPGPNNSLVKIKTTKHRANKGGFVALVSNKPVADTSKTEEAAN